MFFLEHFYDEGHSPNTINPTILTPYMGYFKTNIAESYKIQTNRNLLNSNIGPMDLTDYIK